MPEVTDYISHSVKILKQENIKVNSDQTKGTFVEFLTDRFPDMRRILNDLQKYSVTGELIFPDDNQITDLVGYIIKGLAVTKLSSLEIRKKVIESEKTFSNDYQALLKDMFDYVYASTELPDKVKKNVMIDIGEHLYRDNFVLDHEINFFCCVLAIENSLS